MASPALVPDPGASLPTSAAAPRHSALVRVTHWITALCFLALLVSGLEIVISHPRFYWGEVGNVHTPSLFDLPIPSSRSAVQTGYGFVLPDQNWWSRSLHFEAAWLVVFTGFLYVFSGLASGHFRKDLVPAGSDLRWPAFSRVVLGHLRLQRPDAAHQRPYNTVQQLTYIGVVFVLFPVMIGTGLAMSPAVVSAFPAIVTIWGGHQSARTVHFLGTALLVLFLLVHVGMVLRTGFRSRMRAMLAGSSRMEEGS